MGTQYLFLALATANGSDAMLLGTVAAGLAESNVSLLVGF